MKIDGNTVITFNHQTRGIRLRDLDEPYRSILLKWPEVREVLETLCDLQNGPPLHKYEKQWTELMDSARALLASLPKE